MTLPYEDDFSSDPLSLTARHLAAITGLSVGVEELDVAESTLRRRAQLDHLRFALGFAAQASAESLARIADALEKIAGADPDTPHGTASP